MLITFVVLSKAQQRGVGINTTRPSATLDVVANTTDNAMADAVLVPRMTASELLAKDNNSGTYGAPQNGAIIYITSGSGNTSRTNKITGAGFYYFDNSVPEWKTLGGNGASTMNFQIQKGRLHSTNAPITWADDDYSIVTTAMGNSSQLLLPAAASLPLNSVRCVSANGPGNIGWDPAAVAGSTRPINNLPSNITAGGSFCFITVDQNGTKVWGILSGR